MKQLGHVVLKPTHLLENRAVQQPQGWLLLLQ